MKKLFIIIFSFLSISLFATEASILDTESLYKEAEKLTSEYIASCKTLKIVASKDMSLMQKEDLENIIRVQENNLETYRKSLELLKNLKKDFDSFSDEKKEETTYALYLQQEKIKTLNSSLSNAINLNKAALENYDK